MSKDYKKLGWKMQVSVEVQDQALTTIAPVASGTSEVTAVG